MFDILNKYMLKGCFSFSLHQSYKDCCNAPDNKAGVYLIYKIEKNKETLLYIGSSGRKGKDGCLKIRKGGIKDRLINGYHPNRFNQEKRIKRSLAFPQQMAVEQINSIKIYWWVTYDETNKDFPTDIEALLNCEYRDKYGKPAWHK